MPMAMFADARERDAFVLGYIKQGWTRHQFLKLIEVWLENLCYDYYDSHLAKSRLMLTWYKLTGEKSHRPRRVKKAPHEVWVAMRRKRDE